MLVSLQSYGPLSTNIKEGSETRTEQESGYVDDALCAGSNAELQIIVHKCTGDKYSLRMNSIC